MVHLCVDMKRHLVNWAISESGKTSMLRVAVCTRNSNFDLVKAKVFCSATSALTVCTTLPL